MPPTHLTPTLLNLFLLFLLLVALPVISSPSSTPPSALICPVAPDLELPTLIPCPSVPEMTVKEYLRVGHCCLQERIDGRINVDVAQCGTSDWAFTDDACATCFCKHFSRFPLLLEATGILSRAKDDTMQKKIKVPGARMEDWVLFDFSQYIIDQGLVSITLPVKTSQEPKEQRPLSK